MKENTDTQSSGCGRCGQVRKQLWKDRPAREAECRKCHKKGHFAKECRSTGGVHEISIAQRESVEEQDFAFLAEMGSEESDEWEEKLQLNGEETVSKLECGTTVTVIPSSIFSITKHGNLQPLGKVQYGPGNHRLDVKGKFKGKLGFEKRATEQDIYVVKGLCKPLLGLPALKALTLIQRVYAVQAQQEDFKALYPTVFSRLGKLKEPYKIELEPGAVPYALSSLRRVPLSMREKVRAELKCMEDMGVISKVTQPTPWYAGMVVAPKPQPGKIRLCVWT